MIYETIEQIEALTLDDLLIEVVSRLLDLSVLPAGAQLYNLDGPGATNYEKLQLHISLEKPSLDSCNAELDFYKGILIDQFNARDLEKERQDALNARFEALEDLRVLMTRLGKDEPNLKKYVHFVVKDNLIAEIEALEAENIIYVAEKAVSDDINAEIEIGAKIRAFTTSALNLIIGWNVTNNLSVAEINQMKQDFEPIYQALVDGMPDTAKALIEAADSAPFEPLKVKLLKLYELNGL